MLNDISALARQHGPAAIAKLVEIMGSADRSAAAVAAKALLDRGFGQPTLPVAVEADGVHVEVNAVTEAEGTYRPNGKGRDVWDPC
jgi:hypothetical protein